MYSNNAWAREGYSISAGFLLLSEYSPLQYRVECTNSNLLPFRGCLFFPHTRSRQLHHVSLPSAPSATPLNGGVAAHDKRSRQLENQTRCFNVRPLAHMLRFVPTDRRPSMQDSGRVQPALPTLILMTLKPTSPMLVNYRGRLCPFCELCTKKEMAR